ncbi:MAG TPA: hypothetical protein VFJ43_14885 [Bacteroidia bacterium]|nr:hypothetical protein [Bacteroidia bacterium]
MPRFLSVLPSILFFVVLVFSGCDHTEQDKAEAARKKQYSDSIDSITVVIATQKLHDDSAKKLDNILRDSCPELKEYIRLNKSAIAIVGQVGTDKVISKKYDAIFDSIKKEENHIMNHQFKKMSATNQMRFIHLSLLYTNILGNSLIDQTGLNLSHVEAESNDSLVWKIENGK